MGRLGGALSEVRRMDEIASRKQWVNQIHPLVKLMVTALFLVLAMSFSPDRLAFLLRMGAYPIALFILGEVPFWDSLRRLRVVLPLVCLTGALNPFFDRSPGAELFGVPVTAGVLSMLALMVKGIYGVLASYLLIATTPIEEICYALRKLRVPAVLVTQFLLTCRYISLLLEEAGRVMQAYSLRAPGQKGVRFRAWGSLAGQLLLRSMDRADEVYQSMALRGFRGEFCQGEGLRCRAKDYLYLAVWAGIFFLLCRCG